MKISILTVTAVKAAKGTLAYQPEYKIESSIDDAMPWYIQFIGDQA